MRRSRQTLIDDREAWGGETGITAARSSISRDLFDKTFWGASQKVLGPQKFKQFGVHAKQKSPENRAFFIVF
jgi:hypothetical protein